MVLSTLDNLMTISDSSHEYTFLGALPNLYKIEQHADVIFVCRNGRIKAHKLILGCVSRYLSEIFHEQASRDVIEIFLPDIAFNDLDNLMRYLYEGLIRLDAGETKRFKELMELLRVEIPIILFTEDDLERPQEWSVNSLREKRTSRKRTAHSDVSPSPKVPKTTYDSGTTVQGQVSSKSAKETNSKAAETKEVAVNTHHKEERRSISENSPSIPKALPLTDYKDYVLKLQVKKNQSEIEKKVAAEMEKYYLNLKKLELKVENIVNGRRNGNNEGSNEFGTNKESNESRTMSKEEEPKKPEESCSVSKTSENCFPQPDAQKQQMSSYMLQTPATNGNTKTSTSGPQTFIVYVPKNGQEMTLTSNKTDQSAGDTAPNKTSPNNDSSKTVTATDGSQSLADCATMTSQTSFSKPNSNVVPKAVTATIDQQSGADRAKTTSTLQNASPKPNPNLSAKTAVERNAQLSATIASILQTTSHNPNSKFVIAAYTPNPNLASKTAKERMPTPSLPDRTSTSSALHQQNARIVSSGLSNITTQSMPKKNVACLDSTPASSIESSRPAQNSSTAGEKLGQSESKEELSSRTSSYGVNGPRVLTTHVYHNAMSKSNNMPATVTANQQSHAPMSAPSTLLPSQTTIRTALQQSVVSHASVEVSSAHTSLPKTTAAAMQYQTGRTPESRPTVTATQRALAFHSYATSLVTPPRTAASAISEQTMAGRSLASSLVTPPRTTTVSMSQQSLAARSFASMQPTITTSAMSKQGIASHGTESSQANLPRTTSSTISQQKISIRPYPSSQVALLNITAAAISARGLVSHSVTSTPTRTSTAMTVQQNMTGRVFAPGQSTPPRPQIRSGSMSQQSASVLPTPRSDASPLMSTPASVSQESLANRSPRSATAVISQQSTGGGVPVAALLYPTNPSKRSAPSSVQQLSARPPPQQGASNQVNPPTPKESVTDRGPNQVNPPTPKNTMSNESGAPSQASSPMATTAVVPQQSLVLDATPDDAFQLYSNPSDFVKSVDVNETNPKPRSKVDVVSVAQFAQSVYRLNSLNSANDARSSSYLPVHHVTTSKNSRVPKTPTSTD